MSRRYAIYLGLIALLAAINLGRWWLHAATEGRRAAESGKTFAPEDFRLRVGAATAPDGARRDLFQPFSRGMSMTPQPEKPRASKAVTRAQAQPQPQAQALPQPTEAEAAGAALGKLRLLGVVFRAGNWRAYLGLDKENIIALAGETVFGRFVVEKIGVDAVDLRDLKTNISRRIPVSGK